MQGLELCLFLKTIKFVLVILRDSLFSLNQLEIKSSSLFKMFQVRRVFVGEKNVCVICKEDVMRKVRTEEDH